MRYLSYKVLSMALAASMLTACANQIETAPSPLSQMTPDSWNEWVAPDATKYLSWSALKDPILADLINNGLNNNLDIESATQRILSGEYRYTEKQASRHPIVTTSTSAGQSGEIDGGRTATYSASLSASYEIDVWGRREKNIELSGLNLEGAQINMQSTRITVAATIADRYFNIRALDEKLKLQDKFLNAANEQRKFIEARLKAGVVIRNDLDRQDVLIADLENTIEGLKSQRTGLVNSLAVLMGETPGTFRLEPNTSPLVAPEKLAPGTPAEILRNRPDIKFSEINMERSFIDAELVRTDLYPRFSLSTGANTSSNTLGGLFDAIALPWSALTRAAIPILDAKARETQLKLTALGHEQVITSYKKTILSALRDVESALARQESITRQKESLERKITSQQRVSFLSKEKYKQGKMSAIDLLNDENALIRVEQQEVDVWLSSVTSTIGLLRAFGVDPTL